MATGGVFTLITNDGKQDRMLMATDLLCRRLAQVRQDRAQDPTISDPTPTLLDVERTHVLFMNAHFKPFAAIGFEYNKVRPQTGTAQLGGNAQFSIPQFGDFFGDMVVHMRIEPPTVVKGDGVAPNSVSPDPILDTDTLWRWCDYPGERILRRCSFEVNGNPLDDYDSTVYNTYRQFMVQPNKQTGYDRCMGQQDCHHGVEAPVVGTGTAGATSAQGAKEYQECVQVANGNQTPKRTHGVLELFIPLLFWFNKDPRLVIPSVAIPFGQRFINLDLATKDEMCGLLFRGDADATSSLTTPNISLLELFINNIFVNPDIHDIFIRRVGFTLIRVHRRQTVRVDKESEDIQLTKLKWPIEAMFVGVRPSANDTIETNVPTTERRVSNHLSLWHRVGLYRSNFTATGFGPSRLALAGGDPTDLNNALNGDFNVCENHLQRLSITAHGIPIYNDFPAGFYSKYLPYAWGGHNVRTPKDCGWHMFNFCLYPGTYQPSGHINVSRAREFFINFSSNWLGSGNSGTLEVVASAINFLLISDGSAVLRYST